MRVEAATDRDAGAIAQVHVASWQGAYAGIVPATYLASLSVERREVGWKEALASGTPDILVARTESCVTGFVAYGACRDQGAPTHFGEVWALYVLPSHWSTGIGRALWLEALARLRDRSFRVISLWVLAQNERGRRFYQAAGFEVDSGSSRILTLGEANLEELRLMVQVAV